MVYCGVDFDEKFYNQAGAPDFSRAEWYDVKESLGYDFPNLPYFQDCEMKITESGAIMRYIAAKWKPELLHVNDPVYYAKVEMMSGIVADLKSATTMPCYTGAMSRDQLTQMVIEKSKPIVAWMEKHGKHYIAGAELSFVDFIYFELLEL